MAWERQSAALAGESAAGHHEKNTTSDVTSALMCTPDAGSENADVDRRDDESKAPAE